MQCLGHFRLLCSFLCVREAPAVQSGALEVLSLAAANQECVADIGASEVIVYLLLLSRSLPTSAYTRPVAAVLPSVSVLVTNSDCV